MSENAPAHSRDARNLVLPVGAVLGAIIFTASTVWAVSKVTTSMEIQGLATRTQIESLEDSIHRVEQKINHNVSRHDLELWIERLRRVLPDIDVPELP